MNRCALALALVIGSLLQAQVPSPLIRGRVVADETNDPIRNARVAFVDDAGRPPALTDEEGRFTFASAPPGLRSISAAKTGYATATSVASDGVEIRLLKGGTISGRLLDDLGEPLPLVSVRAERVVRRGGRMDIEQVAEAETDDLGEYRVFGLPRGEYLVGMAIGRELVTGGVPSPPAVPRPSQRFYPSAFSIEQAQPIAVGVGTDVVGIDMTVTLRPPGMTFPSVTGPIARTSGTIRGRVLRPDGRPIQRAAVRLFADATGAAQLAAETDAGGQYEFRGLRSGAYRVTVTTLSFQMVSFGRRAGRGDAIPVAAGALVDHVDISMPSRSAISGRVVDEYGDPMADANVRVDRIEFSKGRRRLVSVMNVAPRQTNDLGRYRIFGLPPGRYVVSAVVGQDVPNRKTADWPGYAWSYFPATPVASESEVVEVSDQDRLNVDIALVRGRASRISGHAFTEAGEPMPGVLWLSQSYRSGAIATAPVSARAQPDGAFEFKDVPPGEYVIQAETSWRDIATEGEFAAQFVTLDGRDATNLTLRVTTGSTIAGRLTFEGADPPEPDEIELSAVAMDPDMIALADNPVGRAAIREDRTFELGGVHGPRMLRLLKAPAGWALKSILVNGGESIDAVLPFGTKAQSLSDVEVILTQQVSGVSGVVTDASGRPFGDGVVIVFSTDRSQWFPQSRFLDHVAAASDGAFDLRPLAPGSYYVAAIDPPDDFERNRAFENPVFLESLVAGATRVTLAEGDTRSLSPGVIPR